LNRPHWLLLAMIATGITACQSPVLQPALQRQPLTRTANADADLYPLETGTTWSYRLTQFKNGQPTGRQDTMGTKVVSVNDSLGLRIAKVERTYGTMTLPATQAVRSEDGIVLARWPESAGALESLPLNRGRLGGGIGRLLPQLESTSQPITDNELTISLKVLTFPVQPGQSWAGRLWTFAKETLTAEGWESVTVPAGTFRAWHVTHRIAYDGGHGDTLAYWYAPGAGMIKAHEENTLMMSGAPVRFSVDGELTAISRNR
jgi:hypothetical protein